MEWKRGSASFKRSIKMMQKINCAHPSAIDNNPLDPVTGRKSLSKAAGKGRQLVRKSSDEDDESMETKHRESSPPPKIQFDLSENFRREMELHNIAAEQEKAREEQMRQREKDRKRKENRRRKGDRRMKSESPRADEEESGSY